MSTRKSYTIVGMVICIASLFLFYRCNTEETSYPNKNGLSVKNSKRQEDDKQKAVSFSEKGIYEYQQGNFDSAEKALKKSIEYAENIGNELLILKGYNNIGNIQAERGNNIKAISFYQKALKIAEKINDQKYVAHINKNIGTLYISWKRFDESLNYYYKAEETAISCKDSLLYADCNNNIGTVLEQQGKYDEAIKRYNIAHEVYEKYNAIESISMIYSNIAIACKLKNDYQKAIDYNKQSLEISKKTGNKWTQAATLNNIGNLYGEIGDYEQAKLFCGKSLLLSEEINALEIIYNVYESLADAAFKVKDYENALKYQKLFNKTKDKFNNIEANKHLSELTVKYETEKKEKENTLLKLDNQKQSYETERAKKKTRFILTVAIILLLSTILIFKFYQRNQKNKQIIIQQSLVNKIVFETEKNERSRIARDLHDCVGQKLAVVKMQLSMMQQDECNYSSYLLDETIQDVRTISHNLMPPNLENGLVEALENMRDEFNYNSDQPKMILYFTDNVSRLQLSELITLTVYRIIQEFVNNTVKYAAARKINISMDLNNDNLYLILQDDGSGFDLEKEMKSSGIGLKNITERIKQLNANISMNTTEGTIFSLTIPV